MRLCLCHQHRLVREGLEVLLRERHDVVSSVAAVDMVGDGSSPFDVCLVGVITLDDLAALQAPQLSDAVVIALTGGVEATLLWERCVAAGAAAVVSERGSGAELLGLIDALASKGGARPISGGPQLSGRLPLRHAPGRFLTVRERQVLEELANGMSTQALAELLGVQPATVRAHVRGILLKLGVRSRVEAVAYAVEQGLVRPTARGASVVG